MKIIYTIGGLILCVLTYAGARMWIDRKSRALPRWAIIYERLFDGFALWLLPAVGIFAWPIVSCLILFKIGEV